MFADLNDVTLILLDIIIQNKKYDDLHLSFQAIVRDECRQVLHRGVNDTINCPFCPRIKHSRSIVDD